MRSRPPCARQVVSTCARRWGTGANTAEDRWSGDEEMKVVEEIEKKKRRRGKVDAWPAGRKARVDAKLSAAQLNSRLGGCGLTTRLSTS
ncbi:hypothetical protein BDZ90DRAFT_234842 [Jaminaea rosea]|uniref:Uncharacterized protein n=1 Tax=Jaminaea rosea TaxID=1569628 RepID=A0A316UH21_9BASI|nr:hypothetical protein BDZ90DRAFT_234842 [Jaminaea rosea]PWN24556.1 hypothetical protein BDZ90DRAFT_234842 [Jaminaea rosea]